MESETLLFRFVPTFNRILSNLAVICSSSMNSTTYPTEMGVLLRVCDRRKFSHQKLDFSLNSAFDFSSGILNKVSTCNCYNLSPFIFQAFFHVFLYFFSTFLHFFNNFKVLYRLNMVISTPIFQIFAFYLSSFFIHISSLFLANFNAFTFDSKPL